ncbi:MAG: hypothetical protein K0R54_98 [Clostridiaceae bacterium]|jgi:MoxR-like ATPase|nr:hypothetical protein [Clostridiaceae bacterium]
MAREIYITVTGISAKHPGKQLVDVGDTLDLIKEENEFDKDAIAVYLGNAQVGYVGNSSNTVVGGTVPASEIKDKFNGSLKAKAIITEITTVFFKSRSSKAFICKVIFEKAKRDVIKMEKEFKFKLVGARTLYPQKFLLGNEIANKVTPKVNLVLEHDKIVAQFNGNNVGHIDNKKEDGLSSYDDLKEILKTERVATIIGAVGTHFIGLLKVDESEIVSEQNIKTLKSIVEKIVTEGIATQSEIDKRIAYMKKYGVTERQMITVFSSFKKYPDEVAKRIPNPKTFYIDNTGILRRAIGYINIRRNLLFEGDRGVGKNVLCETLAWLFKRPLYEFSINSQHSNNDMLGGRTFEDAMNESKEESVNFIKGISGFFKIGFKKFFTSNVEENEAIQFMGIFKKVVSYFTGKKITYEPDIIVQSAEYGGILVFDEFNTSYGNVMSLFNSLLDERRRIQVPGYKMVEADDNFFAIATQNKDYQGTFENNEATVDRFIPIVFPTLTNIEDILYSKVKDVSYDTVNRCQNLFKSIKKCVEDGEISEKSLTLRGFIDACMASTMQDISLSEALYDNIANRASDIDDRKSIRNMIEDMF